MRHHRRSPLCALPISLLSPLAVQASEPAAARGISVFGIPFEFVLFGLTLIGVAVLHRQTLKVALAGFVAISLYKLAFTGFHGVEGVAGLAAHFGREWTLLANLAGLLLGFALLSRHFEESKIPDLLPAILPDDWKGGFVLLLMVFVLSSFLDNIAAALIGGTVAHHVFRGRLHIGYLAAIVAASNAGGSGSVVGDTTTTMMWIDGVPALHVLDAYVAAAVAVLVCGVAAAFQQQRFCPIMNDPPKGVRPDWYRIGIVVAILTSAIVTNVVVNLRFADIAGSFPFIGCAVWVALIVCAPLRKPQWSVLPAAFKGSLFLLALVACASMMPVEKLPTASWQSTLGLGFVSAVFDNIPLTKLALDQGGYDWGMLAYAVGFGGSMIWFGSSAGVAVCNLFPEARSVWSWLKGGWHVTVAYVLGFFVMLAILGWKSDFTPGGAG